MQNTRDLFAALVCAEDILSRLPQHFRVRTVVRLGELFGRPEEDDGEADRCTHHQNQPFWFLGSGGLRIQAARHPGRRIVWFRLSISILRHFLVILSQKRRIIRNVFEGGVIPRERDGEKHS